MPLKRIYFDVYLDDPDNPDGYLEFRAEVRGADQLRAELEGKRIGVTLEESMHQTFLWSWAALMRTHQIDMPFKDFRERAIQVKGDKSSEADVDPTLPAVSAGLLSPSQPPTPPTVTTGGSTESPTTSS
jgi:hypothetical protein